MIFEIQAINETFEGDTKETLMVTTSPQKAWDCLVEQLKATAWDNRADYIVMRYWYSDGRMRSQYNINMSKKTAWLYNGEPTPTILKGIEHSIEEAK